MADEKKAEVKKGFWARLFAAIDRHMEEQSKKGACCCSMNDKDKKGCC